MKFVLTGFASVKQFLTTSLSAFTTGTYLKYANQLSTNPVNRETKCLALNYIVKNKSFSFISGFRRRINVSFTILWCYSASSGNFLLTSKVKQPFFELFTLEDGAHKLSQKSVTDYKYMLRNITEEGRCQVRRVVVNNHSLKNQLHMKRVCT